MGLKPRRSCCRLNSILTSLAPRPAHDLKKPSPKRCSSGARTRKAVFEKTGGVCHICGGDLGTRWAVDHVKPLAKGGQNTVENYLPACGPCNRLKWHRSPEAIRRIMQLGVYAKKEIEHNTGLGKRLAALFERKERLNGTRRVKPPGANGAGI